MKVTIILEVSTLYFQNIWDSQKLVKNNYYYWDSWNFFFFNFANRLCFSQDSFSPWAQKMISHWFSHLNLGNVLFLSRVSNISLFIWSFLLYINILLFTILNNNSSNNKNPLHSNPHSLCYGFISLLHFTTKLPKDLTLLVSCCLPEPVPARLSHLWRLWSIFYQHRWPLWC